MAEITSATQATKAIYRFDEGDASMADLLGGKGSNLCEMVSLGLPVPPGFVISTQVCQEYYALGNRIPQGLSEGVKSNVHLLEKSLGRTFGSATNPLLLSVRSGAKVSMPGMMDTILNLGINDDIVKGLASMMGDPRPAFDAYRRFLQIYANVVLEVPAGTFEEILATHKQRAGVELDYQLNEGHLKAIIADYKGAVHQAAGAEVPVDPWQQLDQAVSAVFRSWNTPRAIFYRDHNGISHDMGTAVTIMSMVFGNLGETSGTGVLFTRNPSQGDREIYGEFLPNAQGEDVVAGVRTPQDISSLAELMPQVSKELLELAGTLEGHYRDVQDMEFTIEKGRLFLLQTRSAKRTPLAAVKLAVDMANEGLIQRSEAIQRVQAEEMIQLLLPQLKLESDSPELEEALLAKGFGASPGAASGKVYFEADRAAEAAARGEPVILVRPETKPDDIHGITASSGVVTSRGGVTSHAAVVTRGMGIPCIVGCEGIQVDLASGVFQAGGKTVSEGQTISIDGATGGVYLGDLETVAPSLDGRSESSQLLAWADEVRRLGVMANADTPADASQAVAMGASGIGLCRTEHMFLDPQRLPAVRQMLLNAESARDWGRGNPKSDGDAPRQVDDFYSALDTVRQLQITDFTEILRVMGNRPVIIRLLDAPLHEFLPPFETMQDELEDLRWSGASATEIEDKENLLKLADSLREENPMLGHRGCRLGLTFPDIYRMQVEAIITASASLLKQGLPANPEIMIPLTVDQEEMRRLRQDLTATAAEVQKRLGAEVVYKFGTMIETPRAALTAGAIAQVSDFFSIGTNDLTQMTFGFSRDDAQGKFLKFYVEEGVLTEDPFVTLDADGVGALVSMAVAEGRKVRPDLEVGICGEHGGDPASVAFCHRVGLDYVSCSPFRVPVARLAAAQAALAFPQG
ncbi:MAG: pyruvate, phosphate dikinase [SAR202 cluster bacterium Io17-Chloro-G9]|nr:MAG: pyruvate, phosphate dikinase [SAR202 cluster bacterium Io17-Chloro-G9]